MKNYLLLSALLVCVFFSAQSQNSRFSTGISVMIDDALQSYGTNLKTNPVGLLLTGIYHLPNSRFSIGSDLGVAMYTNESYMEDLSDKGYDGAHANVNEEDCYLAYSVFARYNLKNIGPVTPYGQVSLGGSSFFSSKEYTDISGNGTPDAIDPEFDFHGTSFKTGVGGGFLLNFGQMKKEPRTSRVSLDLGVTVNNGSSATYRNIVRARTGSPSPSDAHFYNSKTNNIVYKIGALFRF